MSHKKPKVEDNLEGKLPSYVLQDVLKNLEPPDLLSLRATAKPYRNITSKKFIIIIEEKIKKLKEIKKILDDDDDFQDDKAELKLLWKNFFNEEMKEHTNDLMIESLVLEIEEINDANMSKLKNEEKTMLLLPILTKKLKNLKSIYEGAEKYKKKKKTKRKKKSKGKKKTKHK